MSENQASAYLYANGNAIFFDEDGYQIISMQKQGLCGLHHFHEKYPDAPVVFLELNKPLDKRSIMSLLKNIKKPKKSKQNDTIRLNT